MSSGVTNSILTGVPAVAGTLAATTEEIPMQWRAAMIVLIGLSVLVAIAANLVNIWRATRKEPPVEKQIQNAIDRHEAEAKDRADDQKEALEANFERIDRKLESHDSQFKELWQAVPWTTRRTPV